MRIVLTLIVLLTALTGCDKEEMVSASDLPSEITNYIAIHFSDHAVIQAIKEKDGFKKSYDVMLEGGIKLEFNRKKEIIEIDAFSKLPDSVISSKILSYVNTNYPEKVIIAWELEDKHQQVELDNELELEFGMNGDFLRID